jgi:hypothetical protein
MKIIRVFPRRTNATPIDEFAYVGSPTLFSEADQVHISVTFSWDLPEAERLEKEWRHIAPVTIGDPATGQRGEEFTPGLYLKKGYVILYGTSDVCSLDTPLSTVTGSGAHHALIAPFITRYQGDHSGQTDGDNRNHGIERPLPTVDTSNRYGLVEPFILPNEGFFRGNKARSIDEPLNTITSHGAGALIEPLLVEYHGTSKPYPVSLPVKTITTKDRFGLLEPFMIKVNHSGGDRVSSLKEPLGTLTTKRDNALVTACGFDIRFRMLKNHELKRAQGFPDDYKILGNITEQTKQIGNAVPVGKAKALALVAMGA